MSPGAGAGPYGLLRTLFPPDNSGHRTEVRPRGQGNGDLDQTPPKNDLPSGRGSVSRYIYFLLFGCTGSSLLLGLFVTSRCGERGHSPAVVRWLLTAVTSLFGEQGLSSCGFQALERRVNRWGTQAYLLQGMLGIFPDWGSNLCLLHWPEDSLPLSHQGSPEGLLWKQSPGW